VVLSVIFSMAASVAAVTAGAGPSSASSSFAAGDLVVYRVGTGSGALTSAGTAVFLDEYSPTGTLVQSIALPTTTVGTNHRYVDSGTATSDGQLTLSADGQYLLAAGYDSGLGTAGVTGTNAVTVARVDANAAVDTSTALPTFASGNNVRSATSTDGNTIWVAGGAGGIGATTLGSTTSVALSGSFTNFRQVNVFGGQLYASSNKKSIAIASIGSGTPTSGTQTVTNLPGVPTTVDVYGFLLLTLGAGPSPDTLYFADNTAGAIEKYGLSGGSWVAEGSIAVANVVGVTGTVDAGHATLYATITNSSGTSGVLSKVTDAGGAGAAASGSPSVIATAATNQAFRGVAFSPSNGSSSTTTTTASSTTTTTPAGPQVPPGVQLFTSTCTTVCPPHLGSAGGTTLSDYGYGSSLYPVPGSTSNEFYGVTDRGPNVSGPGPCGCSVLPDPNFNPAIGKFKLDPVTSKATFEQNIALTDPAGNPYSGKVNSQNNTGETLEDLNGNVLATDPNGYDSEGLAAAADGTFWVSDEYGPFVTHFDATGKQVGRYSPFDATLPHELSNRVPNRGLEGLTVTPDGTTLVAMMQSALQQPDIGSLNAKKIAPLRITTIKLATGELHEYLYLLDNPGTNSTAVSEIAALTNTTFLVDERDGSFPPGAYKKLWKIDLSGATDVGPTSTAPGATYDPNAGGLLLAGKTIEETVGTRGPSAAQSTLAADGITVVSKSLFLDLGHLLDSIDPTGKFFSHDKIEGVAALNGGNNIVLSNDSDFGIDGVTNSSPPYQLHTKLTTAGVQDEGEFLAIDMTQLNSQAEVPETPNIPLLIISPVILLGLYVAWRRGRRRTVPA
jgi:hypothetical protein